MPQLILANVDIESAIDELMPRRGSIKLQFEDGEIMELPIRKVIFHMFYWTVVRKWKLPITSEYLVDTTVINSNTLTDIGTRILNGVMALHPTTYRELCDDIKGVLNRLNNHTIDECQEYHRSLSVLDLAKLTQIPSIKKIINDKVEDLSMSMADSQKKLNDNFDLLFEELKKPYPDNSLYQFAQLKFINKIQLAHTLYQVGFRTDITDNVIPMPVVGNYLNGLKNHREYAFEALSAKKSVFYNLVSIPTAEYFGRKQHLLLSNIKTLHPGDCGTKLTNSMLIDDTNKGSVLYKNIIDGTRLVTLDEFNIDKYVGKVVKFRSPMACRHRDGICEICAGRLLSSIAKTTHVGIFSAIQMTAKVTQVILSSKHFQNTDILEYKIHKDLAEYFIKRSGCIYVRSKQHSRFKKITLTLSMDDASKLLNIRNLDLSNMNVVNESSFGLAHGVVLMRDGKFITDALPMTFKKQTPLYHKALIKYIGDHPDSIYVINDIVHISLKDFDFKKPLFKLIVVNNSMVKFVDDVKKFLENEIAHETSATNALKNFSTMLYNQNVRPNIAYLEVVIKAIMVSGRFDLRVPIVNDLDDVKFASNDHINKFRSLGVSFAYQGLQTTLNDPAFFLTPKAFGEFDNFLNLKPEIQS